MSAPRESRSAEDEVFHAFGRACQDERDRRSLAVIAEQDRRFEEATADRIVAEMLAARWLSAITRS